LRLLEVSCFTASSSRIGALDLANAVELIELLVGGVADLAASVEETPGPAAET